MSRDPKFAELIEALGKAKQGAENSAAQVAAAKAEIAAAEAAIAAAREANDGELEARADARAEGRDRPDAPLADLPALEAAAEVGRRLLAKLQERNQADREAFNEANRQVMTARATLAQKFVASAGIGFDEVTTQLGDLPPETRREPRKLAFDPAVTLGDLARLWAAKGLADSLPGPRGTFAGFVASWLSEPSQDHRDAARLEARKAAHIDD